MADAFDRQFEEQVVGEKAQRPTALKKLIDILKLDDQIKGAFCYNNFTNDPEHAQDNILFSHQAKKGSTISEADMICLRGYIANKYNISPSKNNLEDAMIFVAMLKSYHPIKQYIEQIRWDGEKRLDSWLTKICGTKDNEYFSSVGRKLFTAAVKRIYEPGCYYAQLVILEGRQRMFKSRLVKAMGQDWYASIHLKTRDSKSIVEDMRGKWILEIEELAGFNKQDTEYMKAFVSRQQDTTRVSYGRRSYDYPRQSIMIATMNPEEGANKYLVDVTGNVRYWPVECGDGNIDIDAFEEMRDQIYAEAYVLYKENEPLWLTTEKEHELATKEQEIRMKTDDWEPTVFAWLEQKRQSLLSKEVLICDIATECLEIPIERVNMGVSQRIGRIMAKSGWQKLRKNNGARNWYYIPPPSPEVDLSA